MIINFLPRFTIEGEEIARTADSKKLSLAGMSRLLLGETIDEPSREALQVLVSQRICYILEELCDTFYGSEKWKIQTDFSERLAAIILLVRENLHDAITGFNGEESKTQQWAGLILMNHDLHTAWVTKNSLFWTNIRIFIASCFRQEKICWLIHDINQCLQVRSGSLPFSQMIERFKHELRKFSCDGINLSDVDDTHQEACLVLWNCVQKYCGRNFIPLRQYFLRSLKNKKIDIVRARNTNKRKISQRTDNSSAESLSENRAQKEIAKRYMNWYYEWLNTEGDDSGSFFIGPTSIGEYFPEVWKSLTESQKIKATDYLFCLTIDELIMYTKTQIPENHFSMLQEFFSTERFGIIFLRFLFSTDLEENLNLDTFFQIYIKGRVSFDWEFYRFWDIWDLQEKFLTMCREIIEYDPMIQLSIQHWKKWNEVPF